MAPLPLTPQQTSLITSAKTLISSIPPSTPQRITDHTVSSATLTSHNRIFTGINTFHFTGSVCAENVAFANAAAGGVSSMLTAGFTPEGKVGIESGKDEGIGKEELLCVVAVTNDARGVISPCGRCRQFMSDYYPGIRVIVKTGVGEELGTVGIDELLPYAYVTTLRPAGPEK